jgi:hypothetical protein
LSGPFLAKQAIPVFIDDVEKKLGSRSGEELKSVLRAMTPILEVFETLRWTLVGMYLCIAGGICLLLAFHVHIRRRSLINSVEVARDAPCIFCPI